MCPGVFLGPGTARNDPDICCGGVGRTLWWKHRQQCCPVSEEELLQDGGDTCRSLPPWRPAQSTFFTRRAVITWLSSYSRLERTSEKERIPFRNIRQRTRRTLHRQATFAWPWVTAAVRVHPGVCGLFTVSCWPLNSPPSIPAPTHPLEGQQDFVLLSLEQFSEI